MVEQATHPAKGFSWASIIGNDYTIISKDDTHLIIEFRVDSKFFSHYMTALGIIIGGIMASCGAIVGILGANVILGVVGMVIVFVGIFLAGVFFIGGRTINNQQSNKPYQVTLDKLANKMIFQFPFTSSDKDTRFNIIPRQNFSPALDLNEVAFRLVHANELHGTGTGLMRALFKNHVFIALSTSRPFFVNRRNLMNYPHIFFATGNNNQGQALIAAIEQFLRR